MLFLIDLVRLPSFPDEWGFSQGLVLRVFGVLYFFSILSVPAVAGAVPSEFKSHFFSRTNSSVTFSFYDVPATIRMPSESGGLAKVVFDRVDGRELWVDGEGMRRAQRIVSQSRVKVSLSSGGLMYAKAVRVVVLEHNGIVEPGIEVEYDELQPESGTFPATVLIRKQVRLGDVYVSQADEATNPLSVPAVDQRFLLGTVFDTWPAVPVVVLGARQVEGRDIFYFVMEQRDLTDGALKLGHIYFVPASALRSTRNIEEFEYFASLPHPKPVRFRQTVLMPWTHRNVLFPANEPQPELESADQRLARRLEFIREELGERGRGSQLPTGVNSRTCKDFLYLPE